jgi:hypothetical protein
MVDADTVDIGLACLEREGGRLWDGLKQLKGLKVLRVMVTEEEDSCNEPHHFGLLWDKIVDRVKDRFKNGRPLRAIEPMIVNGDRHAIVLHK